ncbi:MAG: uracil-DNA glycosylase [Gammaproteobacteria bacterium]|nr:uracil-DNA glycosylase [Gammaproteobacteria bacterium]
MTAGETSSLDENTRRYYLDAMGIQCWQLLDTVSKNELSQATKQKSAVNIENAAENDTDVVAVNAAQLQQAIQQCNQCQLYQTRKQAISGRGNLSAKLMIVLISPTANDDTENFICSGKSDQLLSKMLAAININIDDVYISSLLKCYVPQEYTVSAKEIQSCQNHLNRQIQLIQPEILLVLGETAVRCLLQKDLSLDDYRAMNAETTVQKPPHEKLLYQPAEIPLFISYSPEELLQQPENKRKAWADLQQLQKIMGQV